MHIRRLSLALVIAAATVPRVAARQNVPREHYDVRLDHVEQWLHALVHHEPGVDDEAAETVAAWSNRDLRTLWIDLNFLAQMRRNLRLVGISVKVEGQRTPTPIRYPAAELRRFTVLACAAAGIVMDAECMAIPAAAALDPDLLRLSQRAAAAKRQGDDNYILRRGALLHADIAMLVPATIEAIGGPPSPAPQRIIVNVADGREVGVGQAAVHWEIARMLLDFVRPPGAERPAPGGDAMVKQWYRATAAWMQQRENHDTIHLDRARQIFPSDADILFLSGTQRETYAAPPIQSAVRSIVVPTGVRVDIGSDRSELRQAETFFRRALGANPSMPEAHLRFGRVLFLLERHADAATELRQAMASTDERLLRYYGELFLGAAEEALGHFDAARDAYARAAALYPTAQSPEIALSALARRRGDRAAALREMRRVFELPATRPQRDDPWWTYHIAQARNADDLLDELRRPFLGEVDR